MNQHLQHLAKLIASSTSLSDLDKTTLVDALKNADQQMSLVQSAQDQTKKEKTRISLLLKKSLAELKQKTRNLEIEAALERVRARTMAMQQSDQLPETAAVLFEEFYALGNTPDRIGIMIFREDEKKFESWLTDQEGREIKHQYSLNITEPTTIQKIYEAWKNGSESVVIDLTGQELEDWLRYISEEVNLFMDPSHTRRRRVHHAAFFPQGYLHLSTHEPASEELMHILVRFARVFGQTYTRFLDLQKAEAQTREAQIEAALERVRVSAMAMHTSEGLLAVSYVLREQMALLEEKDLESTVIHIYDAENDNFQGLYSYRHPEDPMGPIAHGKVILDWNNTARARKDKEKYYSDEIDYTIIADRKMLEEWYHYLDQVVPEVVEHDDTGKILIPDVLYYNYSKFAGGALLLITNREASGHSKYLLKRSAEVFNLAYTRFLDLQKAEAQAREAQIEAALERVRSRTMAMHQSSELAEAGSVLFEQLATLGIEAEASWITLINPDEDTMTIWTTHGKRMGEPKAVKANDHPNFKAEIEAWKSGEKHINIPMPKEGFLQIVKEVFDLDVKDKKDKSKFHILNLRHRFGFLGLGTWEEVKAQELSIYRRFANVFEQTYTRFLDLQKAEAQARDALKQASLDRVRGQIASMRSVEDLNRITPLIWNELNALGVPFIRCGVFIIDEALARVQVYLSDSNGQPLAAMAMSFESTALTADAVRFWRKGKLYRNHWSREDFVNWTESMIEQGYISDKDSYQGTAKPPESLDLHFVPFNQGMLYVGNVQPLSEDELELVMSLAKAFALAYARYEDFTKLEKAKEEVESTLTELKATQAQLIQSEKMASLGVLTAGISHEIQNPLNFVNNFAKVSSELLEELKEDLPQNDNENVAEIVGLLSQNLEKIHHHGERASSIVKGMLQHSRSNTGEKEPTDINALCQEYFRLAYHGIRAKDKNFNVTMETSFDESLKKINVIPQDMGRVLLNLITNAFYACAEQGRKGGNEVENGYAPKVTICTKRVDSPLGGEGTTSHIQISVIDNGTGIPKDKIDKIFQPFFTTKPTGQGTGLGLSLAYDIVKVHQGELAVDSQDGKETTFTISLPQS